ncbi:MAG: hypothetical protein R3C24_05605 [Cyanobacteriota/Melainabacteria group bacterium]|nr:hypothetical protein [Cyanobacteria bacterium HKST-UBA01]MCB9469679.1 hypothetical protein [Candidatus Obscuribacterales bacterium]
MQRLALVGLGASGLFALKELAGADVEVHVFDVGPNYAKRYPCPIDQGKLEVCPPKACSYCAPGQSAGSWNDFKVILSASPVIGGRLYDLIGEKPLQDKLDIVRKTILEHAPVEIPVVKPDKEDLEWITKRATLAGMTYHYQELLHCGSDNAPAINTSILNEIKETGSNIEFHWDTKVLSVGRRGEKFAVNYDRYRNPGDEKEELFDFMVLSVGRGGAHWLTQQEFYKDLDIYPGQVDIGIRVETSCYFTEEVDKRFYEPKLYYTSRHSNDVVRNFCSNPRGYVTPENHRDYVLVNGHSKMFEKSENNNFAVLVSKTFTRPFKDPQLYSQTIAKVVNMLAGGGPLVQKLGDLRAGRRTKTLANNLIKPTLEAECGDISLAYPHRILAGIIEYLDALDKICPGVAGDATLLFAPECKSYPDSISVKKDMETNIPNLFIIGDSSSWTRGVGQATTSGLLAGEGIKKRLTREILPGKVAASNGKKAAS